jgi:hypothetical protein
MPFFDASKRMLEEKKIAGLKSNGGFGKEDLPMVRCRLKVLLTDRDIRLTKS